MPKVDHRQEGWYLWRPLSGLMKCPIWYVKTDWNILFFKSDPDTPEAMKKLAMNELIIIAQEQNLALVDVRDIELNWNHALGHPQIVRVMDHNSGYTVKVHLNRPFKSPGDPYHFELPR